MEGRSLAPLLLGDDQVELPESFVVETQYDGVDKIGVYTEAWKYFDNRDGQPGVNRRALHPTGSTEDSKLTDVAGDHEEGVAHPGRRESSRMNQSSSRETSRTARR